MKKEPVVLDKKESIRVTREAIASLNPSSSLENSLAGAIVETAQTHKTLTADEIWETLGWIPTEKGDSSSLGALIVKAKKTGIIKRAGTFEESKRPKAHSKPLPVWKSLIHIKS